MSEGGENPERPDRRKVLRMMGAAAVAALPGIPNKVSAAESMLPIPELLRRFQNDLGPKGGMWPRLREGRFTDKELDQLFASLARITKALNTKGPKIDPTITAIQERLPDLKDVPHLYTISTRSPDGKYADFGNCSIVAYKGMTYLQTAQHVIDVFRKSRPDLYKLFTVPPVLRGGDPLPDVTVARFENVPVLTAEDEKAVEMPADFDPLTVGGQLNVIMGYKEDGGFIRHASLVLPTPPAMRRRLWKYFGFAEPTTAEEAYTIARMEQGGLILVPEFFGEIKGIEPRSAARSGSVRYTESPLHRAFIPTSGFFSIVGNSRMEGFAAGFVDSASHLVRALKEADAQKRPSLTYKTIDATLGVFEIAPDVFLRKVHTRVPSSHAQK